MIKTLYLIENIVIIIETFSKCKYHNNRQILSKYLSGNGYWVSLVFKLHPEIIMQSLKIACKKKNK